MNTIWNFLRKAILFIPFISLFTPHVFSKPRTSGEALLAAQSFLTKTENPLLRSVTPKKTLSLAYACSENILTKSASEPTLYYVFNVGTDNGFIIVSGDDRAKSILGYSDCGRFSKDSIPVNFRNWLAMYKLELSTLSGIPDSQTSSLNTSLKNTSASVDTRKFATSISPLLGDIKWNQSYPYNLLCPVLDGYNAPTGCVATAMAQIMKYHQWPIKGYGKKSYKQSDITDSLKADFGNTTYDWTKMNPTYAYNTIPGASDTAVARLMYHCGVAVEMTYASEGSAAYSNDVPSALSQYFGYDANAQILNRDYYTYDEWVYKIKQELNLSRPILYGGADIEGTGHQFVCDGYDTNNLFHFNWGWSGHYNGYFELSSLNVETPGIGGGSGGYSIGQDMIIGIQKPSGSSIKTYEIVMLKKPSVDTTVISRQGKFNFNFGFANIGGNTFTGEFAIALYQDNNLVTPLVQYRSVVLQSYYGNGQAVADSLSIPVGVTRGTYQIYTVYRGSGDTDWKYMRGRVGTANYINATVGTNTITFSTPDVYPILALTDTIKPIGRIYKNKTSRYSASIENNGGEFNSNILITAKSISNNQTLLLVIEPINIPTGTTKTFEFSTDYELDSGQYLIQMYYDTNNNDVSPQYALLGPSALNSPLITVLNSPTTAPKITLQEKIAVTDTTVVNGSDVTLKAKIKNIGGFFNNDIAAFIFSDTARYSVDYLGPVKVVLDSAEEKSLSLAKSVALPDGEYKIQLFCYNDSTSKWAAITPLTMNSVRFHVVTPTSSTTNATFTQPIIFPNPAKNVLRIISPAYIRSIIISDLSGKTLISDSAGLSGIVTLDITHLNNGLYIIQVETDKGRSVSKFYKL